MNGEIERGVEENHVLPDAVDLAVQGLGLVVALREHLLHPPRRRNIRGVMDDLDSLSAGISSRADNLASFMEGGRLNRIV